MKKLYLLLIIITSFSFLKGQSCVADYFFNTTQNSLRVNFYDLSTYPANMSMNYSWWFSDGTASSNQPTTFHTFSQPGTYIVYLSIFNNQNNCFDSTSYYVTVPGSANQNCNAYFTAAKDTTTNFGVVLTNFTSNLSSNSYYWDFGDGDTSTLRNPVHTYRNFGSYVIGVRVTESNSLCSNIFSDTITMDSTGTLKANGFSLRVIDPQVVGIDEDETNYSVDLYPNPASNQFNIDLGNYIGGLELRMINIKGQSILALAKKSYRGKFQMDIASLPDGIYFLEMKLENSRIVKKFIKN